MIAIIRKIETLCKTSGYIHIYIYIDDKIVNCKSAKEKNPKLLYCKRKKRTVYREVVDDEKGGRV